MPDPLITLTTDFGEDSPYVAAMKGVILSLNPQARLLDLGHQIPPQDVGFAAFFLAAALPYFPPGTLHVIVVDPGVGTERALLYVETNGQRLLVPDNGCWTTLLVPNGPPPYVLRLAEPRFWRQPVSSTFHGRDILAPVAGHLSLGVAPPQLGPPVDQWIRYEPRQPVLESTRLAGEVVFVDRFGNLITNIPGAALVSLSGPLRFQIGDREVRQRVQSYAEARPGMPVALVSSGGMLEIAVTNGHAAKQLGAGVSSRVLVTPAEEPSAPS